MKKAIFGATKSVAMILNKIKKGHRSGFIRAAIIEKAKKDRLIKWKKRKK